MSSPDYLFDERRQRRRRHRIVAILVIVLILVAMLGLGAWFYGRHLTEKRKLPSRGGLYFIQQVEVAVPQFRQSDPKWRHDLLGWTDENLGAVGCAVASAAMVLKSYGVETDPQRLNWYLSSHGGYTNQGWLYWEKAAELAPDRVQHIYEDLPSYWLIDSNLLKGNPVIIRVRFPHGTTHFVVIVGKRGFDYLIRDPGAGAKKGVYPLRELTHEIEALRFYKKIS